MNEKIYKTMGLAAGSSITTGIITIVIGVAAGIISIITGCVLLNKRKNITF